MSKHRRISVAVGFHMLLIAASVLVGCRDRPGSAAPAPSHTHILVLTVDTLRADHVGHRAHGLTTTPFLDTLLASGFRFTRAVTPIPRTTQALASMLTGCYPHTTKVRTLYDQLSPDVVSLAELAKRQGYSTIAVVSNHVLVPRRGLNRGFDVYDFADESRDAAGTTAAAIRQLTATKPEDDIFAWVHYIDPHVPYYAPPELAVQFDPAYRGRYRLHFGAVKAGIGNQAYPEDLPKARAVFRNRLPDELNAHIRKLYAAEVRHTDRQIAELVSWVRDTLGDDWLIVFTSDHGESLGEHDFFYDHGDYVYNATLRVPLAFVFPPGDPLGRPGSSDDRVSLLDVMPTLAELLGISIPAGLGYDVEGRSLVPYFRGEPCPPRPAFAECGQSFFSKLIRRRTSFDVAGRFRAVLSGDWKLIWTPGQTPDLEYELYNVRADPDETADLYAPDHPQVEELRRLLHEWVRVPTGPRAGPTPEDLKALKSLGYVGDDDD